MFELGSIYAYPTDTSFGLGVRADDPVAMEAMYELKQRESGKYFSLMVRDEEMLKEFAELPKYEARNPKPETNQKLQITNWEEWFQEKPRTAILKPSDKLPQSKFWPKDKVAFRICTIPDIAQQIEYPVTATSANLSGEPSIYTVDEIRATFGDQVLCYDKIPQLPVIPASEIWDFTVDEIVRLR